MRNFLITHSDIVTEILIGLFLLLVAGGLLSLIFSIHPLAIMPGLTLGYLTATVARKVLANRNS